MTFWMPKPGMMASGAGGLSLTFPPTLTSVITGQVVDTTHATTLPATINAGDVIIVSYKVELTFDFSSVALAGWENLPTSGNTAANRGAAVIFKIADGSEGGTIIAPSGLRDDVIYAAYAVASSGLLSTGNEAGTNHASFSEKSITFNQQAGKISFFIGTHAASGTLVPLANSTILSQGIFQGTNGHWLGYKTLLATAGTPLKIGCDSGVTQVGTTIAFEQDVA